MQEKNLTEGVMTYDNLNRPIGITWTGAGENFSEAISYNLQTGNIDQIEREFGAWLYAAQVRFFPKMNGPKSVKTQ